MLKHGILGLLNYHEMTGYEIKEVFAGSLNYFWTAQTSQIYRELQTIEKNGWTEGTKILQSGKPDKKIYKITKAGKEELLRWLAYDEVGLSMRTPLLMKIFFLGNRSIEENLAFFRGFRQMVAEYSNGLEAIGGNVDMYAGILGDEAGDNALYWEMTLDYGKRSMQMHLKWADRCIEILESQNERSFCERNEAVDR